MTETKKTRVGKKPRSTPKGWQQITAPDGAKYRVLHDTGAYAAYVRKIKGEKSEDDPKST